MIGRTLPFQCALLITFWANNALGDVLVQPGYGQPQPLPTQFRTSQPFLPGVWPAREGPVEIGPYAQPPVTGPYHLEVHPVFDEEAAVGVPGFYGRTFHGGHHFTRLGGYTHVAPSLFVGQQQDPLAVHRRYRRSAGSAAGGEAVDEDGLATESSLGQASSVADLQKEAEEGTGNGDGKETRESGSGEGKTGAVLLKRASPSLYGQEQFDAPGMGRSRPPRPVDQSPAFDPRYMRNWAGMQRSAPLARNYPDPRPLPAMPPLPPAARGGNAYQGRYRNPYPPVPQLAQSQGSDEIGRGDEIVGTKFGKLHKHHPMKHHHHPIKIVDPPHYECPPTQVPCNCPCQTNPPVYVIYKPNEPITNPPCVTPEPPTTPCPVQICDPPVQPPPCPPPPCPPQICEPPTPPCPEQPPCPIPEPPPCPIPEPPQPCTIPEPPQVNCPPQKYVILPSICNNCPTNYNYEAGYPAAPSYTITASTS